MSIVAKVTHDSGIRIERLKQSSRESEKGRNARKARTEKENFASKKDALINIWFSGKYTTKARCAEEEYSALGISYDTARKALRNLPKIKGASTK